MNPERDSSWWLKRFNEVGALWSHGGQGPHVRHRLTPHHCDSYLNTDILVASPEILAEASAEFERRIDRLGPYDWIVAPKTSITAGATLADHLGQTWSRPWATFDLGSGILSREIKSGATALLVTDDVHGGGGVTRTLEDLRRRGIAVRGPVCALADLSDREKELPFPLETLARLELPKWSPEDCHLCRAGSLAVDARASWAELMR